MVCIRDIDFGYSEEESYIIKWIWLDSEDPLTVIKETTSIFPFLHFCQEWGICNGFYTALGGWYVRVSHIFKGPENRPCSPYIGTVEYAKTWLISLNYVCTFLSYLNQTWLDVEYHYFHLSCFHSRPVQRSLILPYHFKLINQYSNHFHNIFQKCEMEVN